MRGGKTIKKEECLGKINYDKNIQSSANIYL